MTFSVVTTEIKKITKKTIKFKNCLVRNIALSRTKKEFNNLRKSKDPFFITIIPGSLHVFDLFEKTLPTDSEFVLILNGLDDWEVNWIKQKKYNHQMINIAKKVNHSHVIDLIIDNFDKPFGIIDYDCFVFDQSYFQKIKQLQPNTMLNTVFISRNEILNLDIPQTFFLFFNTSIIRELIKKYQITCKVVPFSHTSNEVKQELALISIDETHLPEESKDRFDTCKLLFSLGLAEGYSIGQIGKFPVNPTPNYEIYHIGSVSAVNYTKRITAMRGNYFWRLCLDMCEDRKLQDYYWQIYGKTLPDEILRQNPEWHAYQSTSDFVDFAKKIILLQSPPFRDKSKIDRLINS